MITEALMDAVGAVWGWLLALLPSVSLPEWVAGEGSTSLVSMLQLGVSLPKYFDGWVAASVVYGFAALCLTAFVVRWAVKVVRIVASFVTLGGGSAA